MNLNFNNIPENQVQESKSVKPGVNVFTITSAESKVNKNDNAYLLIEFATADEKKFKALFYINSDKGLARVKELANNSGIELGEITVDALCTKLIGAKVGLIVDGEEQMADINGKLVKVTRPVLRFAKFSFKADAYEDFKNTPTKLKPLEPAITAVADPMAEMAQGSPAVNDLPF